MNRLTITAGTGEDRHGSTIAPHALARALATIRGELATLFGGFTETQAIGGWVNPEGRMVMEPSARWIALADTITEETARRVALEVGRVLNQAAVVWELETIAAGFAEVAHAEPERAAA